MVEVIERTPLADVEALPISWIAAQAPPLIAEILGQLSDPGAARELELPPAALRRAESLAEQRDADVAASRLPRELAALQGLLIDALGRESRERDRGEFARAVSRLAEVFGAVQSAAMQSLVEERSGAATPDPQTGLPGMAQLYEWLRILIGQSHTSGGVFSIGHFEVEGDERIGGAFGKAAARRMIDAVVGLLQGRLTVDQRAFRIAEASFVVTAPGSSPTTVSRLGHELAQLVDSSQADTSPRVAVTVGIASWPRHGPGPEELLDAAEQAAWRARASGEIVAVAAEGSLQDP